MDVHYGHRGSPSDGLSLSICICFDNVHYLSKDSEPAVAIGRSLPGQSFDSNRGSFSQFIHPGHTLMLGVSKPYYESCLVNPVLDRSDYFSDSADNCTEEIDPSFQVCGSLLPFLSC